MKKVCITDSFLWHWINRFLIQVREEPVLWMMLPNWGDSPQLRDSNFSYQYEGGARRTLDDPNVANPTSHPSETTTYQICGQEIAKRNTAELVRSLPP